MLKPFTSPSDWPDLPSEEISEGLAKFRVVSSDSIYDAPTFFNPVMALNRDFSLIFAVVYARKFNKKLRILDPLAGIGVRGIRAALEISDYVDEIVMNDLDELTVQQTLYNIIANNVQGLTKVYNNEARALMLSLSEQRKKYHYLDLDPFGPPTPFIDAVWSTLSISGMVSITATDTTALCGVYPKACLRKYGSIPLNNHHTHETGARILISTISQSAARLGYGIIPIFSLSADHYFKIFVYAVKGRGDANDSVSQIGYSYTCQKCFTIQYIEGLLKREISCCGGEIESAGPLWTGELFSQEWVLLAFDIVKESQALKSDLKLNLTNPKRVIKILEEARLSHGLKGYFTSDVISKSLRISQPSFKKIQEILETSGFRFVRTRFTKHSFRTNAPGSEIIKIFVDHAKEVK